MSEYPLQHHDAARKALHLSRGSRGAPSVSRRDGPTRSHAVGASPEAASASRVTTGVSNRRPARTRCLMWPRGVGGQRRRRGHQPSPGGKLESSTRADPRTASTSRTSVMAPAAGGEPRRHASRAGSRGRRLVNRLRPRTDRFVHRVAVRRGDRRSDDLSPPGEASVVRAITAPTALPGARGSSSAGAAGASREHAGAYDARHSVVDGRRRAVATGPTGSKSD